MFEQFIQQTGMAEELVQAALTTAISESLFNCLDIYDCNIDLQEKTAVGVFRVPQDMSFEEALFFNKSVVSQDIVTVRFDFASFPESIIKYCSEAFPRILVDMERSARYREWQGKKRTVVEGVVTEKTRSEVRLDLGGQTGFLMREEWVLNEAQRRYRKGSLLCVYVSRVERSALGVKVFVSRQSRNLPALLFKERVPWYGFTCVYRKAGDRSVVLTECPSRDNTLKAAKKYVEGELGERLKVKAVKN
jgi:hypothetical protein